MTIDDGAMRELRRFAARTGLSLKEAVNRAIRAGLAAIDRPRRRGRRRSPVFRLGRPRVGLDHALRLAAELEDEEVVRKVSMRK
jgi:hypothetical protein